MAHPRLHFALTQQAVPAVISALLNGLIAWAMHRGNPSVPLWGAQGFGGDLISTGLLLPVITWLVLHPLLRHQAAKGKAPPLGGVPTPALAPRLPSTRWGGAAATGLIGIAIGAALAGVLHMLGVHAMSGIDYAWFKGVYGGVLPALLQPAMVFAILRGVAAAPLKNQP